MGLLDGLLEQVEGAGISMIASKLGMDPMVAQGVAGTILSKLSNGQDPQAAAAEAAAEHGIDEDQANQVAAGLADHAGADGIGGLVDKLGGADAITGMLGGLLGGGGAAAGAQAGGGGLGGLLSGLASSFLKK
jgi:hypothetical protein